MYEGTSDKGESRLYIRSLVEDEDHELRGTNGADTPYAMGRSPARTAGGLTLRFSSSRIGRSRSGSPRNLGPGCSFRARGPRKSGPIPPEP